MGHCQLVCDGENKAGWIPADRGPQWATPRVNMIDAAPPHSTHPPLIAVHDLGIFSQAFLTFPLVCDQTALLVLV